MEAVQLAWTEVLSRLNYPEVEKVVKSMLRGYKRIEGEIQIRERQALGKGIDFHLTVDTSTPLYKEDKLQPLHAQLRRLPEEKYLSPNELKLLEVVRKHLTEHRTGTKSQLYSIQSEAYYALEQDEKDALYEVADMLQNIVEARGYDALYVEDQAIKRVLARRVAEMEAEELRYQKDLIEQVLNALKAYNPDLEKLLRLRYIENKPVDIVSDELGITDRTYRRWKHEAICEFSTMAKII